jgi:hypothetical protein
MHHSRSLTRSLSICLLLVSFTIPALAQKNLHDDSTVEKQRREKHRKDFEKQHSDQSGKPRPDLVIKAINQIKHLKIVSGAPAQGKNSGGGTGPTSNAGTYSGSAPLTGVQWTQNGPAPLLIEAEQNFQGGGPDAGQIVDIAIDPRNTTDQIIYVATNGGGVWKSIDGGKTWAPKTDAMPSGSIGALALDGGNPSVVYAGTGNDFDNNGRYFGRVGIYKSVDAGETWFQEGQSVLGNRGIIRMVSPAANVLVVATTSGLYWSKDGGAHFGRAPNYTDSLPVQAGYISDLHLDTANSSIVYAAVDTRQSSAVAGGIYKTTDNGATFTNLFTGGNGAPTSNFGFISFGQSTSPDNKTIYASVEDTTVYPTPPPPVPNGVPFKGVYVSNDTGGTWTLQANPTAGNKCQCNYDQTIGVDPKDATRVYLGFQNFWVSTDSAVSFTQEGGNDIHDDHHALVFSPSGHVTTAVTPLYVGHDGGISFRSDTGTYTNLNGAGGTAGAMATNLFRGIDIGRNDTNSRRYTFGGMQDTGVAQRTPATTLNDWELHIDGDGGTVVVDPSNANNAYTTDDGIYTLTTNAGGGWSSLNSAATGLPDCGGQFVGKACANPVAVDPNNSANVYASGNDGKLYFSTDQGQTFKVMKDFSSKSGVTSAAIVKIDSNTLWVGLGDGTVQYTNNALAGAASIWNVTTAPNGVAGQGISSITVSPLNTGKVAVAYGGFCGGACGSGAKTRHAFLTTDSGATWTDVGPTIDTPLHTIIIDTSTTPDALIVGTDTAVLRSSDNGATYSVFGVGLPTVFSSSLAFDATASPALLRIGTYGRSSFELTAATGPLLAINSNLAFGNACVGGTTTGTIQLFNVGSQNLSILSITPAPGSSGDFTIGGPGMPATILPGEELDFTVSFTPKASDYGQNITAVFQINSTDQFQPVKLVNASASILAPSINAFMASTGNFGNICQGSFADLPLTIGDNSSCQLGIATVGTATPFLLPNALTLPMLISGGTSTQVPVRFQPTGYGAVVGSVSISSTDPVTPVVTLPLAGNSPPGNIKVTGSSDFGAVCGGTLAEKTINVCDFPTTGACNLNVASAVLTATPSGGTCADFTLVNNAFPAAVSANSCLNLTVRFTPTSAGAKQCTLTVTSDDNAVPNSKVQLTVTGNTPANVINIAPDLGFAPTVTQNIGACSTVKPFVIVNQGQCAMQVNSVAVTTDPTEFKFSGLPSLPISLKPGHQVGEGGLNGVFVPTLLNRDRDGILTVAYEDDPITHHVTSQTRNMCGEGVYTGARVLVTAGGVPLPMVDKIQLQRITGNTNKQLLTSIDVVQNAVLQGYTPKIAACPAFQYHREYGTVSDVIQLSPGSYRVTVQASVNKKKMSQTVGFDTATCGFNPTIVVAF